MKSSTINKAYRPFNEPNNNKHEFRPFNDYEKKNIRNQKNYQNIAGESYTISNTNYFDNYYNRYNHYYITDTNYISDHYIDHDIYHYSMTKPNTSNIYQNQDNQINSNINKVEKKAPCYYCYLKSSNK